jgi:hypothetical protein
MPVMRAMASLLKSGQLKPDELLLQLIGNGSALFGAQADRMGIANMVNVSNRISYSAGLRVLAKSHIALLLGGRIDILSSTTKLFEYIYMKKPIIAVLEGGALWKRLIRGGVPCYKPENIEQIEKLIYSFLIDFKEGRRLPLPAGLPDLNKHSRKDIAKRLAETIEHLSIDQKI